MWVTVLQGRRLRIELCNSQPLALFVKLLYMKNFMPYFPEGISLLMEGFEPANFQLKLYDADRLTVIVAQL